MTNPWNAQMILNEQWNCRLREQYPYVGDNFMHTGVGGGGGGNKLHPTLELSRGHILIFGKAAAALIFGPKIFIIGAIFVCVYVF